MNYLQNSNSTCLSKRSKQKQINNNRLIFIDYTTISDQPIVEHLLWTNAIILDFVLTVYILIFHKNRNTVLTCCIWGVKTNSMPIWRYMFIE